MRDPVTLPSGITYDRDSIEHWLRTSSNRCPVTKLPLSDSGDLIPNHTLRRLIQAWSAAHTSLALDGLPTARQPLGKACVAALLDEARLAPASHLMPVLKKLKKIIDSDGGGRSTLCVEASTGIVSLLATIISTQPSEEENAADAVLVSDEAIVILSSLKISEQGLRCLLHHNEDFLSSLTALMRRSQNYQSREHAVQLLKSLIGVVPAPQLMSLPQAFFEEILKVLNNRISYQAMKSALQVLYGVCSWGKNTVKAVQSGAVAVLVELLLDEPEKRACEMMLVVLDELCGCADGRAALVGHAAGVAVVAKKMVRVSAAATESSVRILYAISLHPGTAWVVEEMLQVGVFSKLCLLLQVQLGRCAREMTKEILKMHFAVWRSSPCLTPQLKALCPSFLAKP